MTYVLYIVLPVLGFLIGWITRWIFAKLTLSSAEQSAKRTIMTAANEAKQQKKDLVYETRELLEKERREQDKTIRERYRELNQLESRLQKKEDAIHAKLSTIEKQQILVRDKELDLEKLSTETNKKRENLNGQLEEIARLTLDEAQKRIVEQAESRTKQEIQDVVYRIEQDALQEAEKKARNTLVMVAQRIASEVSSEITTSVVELPNEGLKGRIIGKEGRNIRVIETFTGADIIIDDASDAVVVSCFNPYRRAIAVQSLNNLVKDGRIHPARIEEEVEKVTQNLNRVVFEEGEKLFLELGIQGSMHADGLRSIGKLKFRTSYGQNLLSHSQEVAILAGMIAKELGADANLAKRGGLLHDVGKGIDSSKDFTHVELGVELAKRMNEPPEVINAIAAHHGDVEHSCLESVIVQIADSMSAARPGARRDTLENYIERLVKLEKVANDVEGVEHAYAVHAGREVRVIINSEKTSDTEVQDIARTICKGIEKELKYPGRVKVTVIRETRIVDYAR